MDIDNTIDDVLERLIGIDGINGTILFSSSAEILGTKMPMDVSSVAIAESCKVLTEMMESVSDFGIILNELLYIYDRYRLTVKTVNNYFLLILVESKPSLSMTNIAINFTVKKLTPLLSDPKFVSRFKEKEGIPFKPLMNEAETNEQENESEEFIRFQEKAVTDSPPLSKTQETKQNNAEKPVTGETLSRSEEKSKQEKTPAAPKRVKLKKSKKKLENKNGFILFE